MTEKPSKQLGSLGPVDLWIRRAAVLCGVLVVVKIAFVLFSHAWGHSHFPFEAWPGFFEACGFLGFTLLVLTGRAMAPWVRRPESYYDPELERRLLEDRVLEDRDHAEDRSDA